MPPKKKNKRRARPWGTGSLWLRDDNRWGWGWQHKGRKYGGTEPTEQEAEAALDATMDRVKRNLPASKVNQTVGEYMEEWMETYILPYAPKGTRIVHRSRINTHIKPDLGDVRLRELRREDVQRFVTGLSRKKAQRGTETLNPAAVRAILACLSAALEQAVKLGRIPENPAHHVTQPKLKKLEIDPLSEEETRLFLREARSHRYGLAFALSVIMGLRGSEVRSLEWGDLKGNRLRVKGTKTTGSNRQIVLPPHLLDWWEEHRRTQDAEREEKMTAGEEWKGGDYLFVITASRRISERWYFTTFKKFLKQCGLREIRPHDLRHSAATLRLLRGEPVHSVAKLLGHSNPAMTLRIYAHVLEQYEEQAADRMNDFLDPITVDITVTEDEKEQKQA